jgi:RNA polymerase sigma factor (sigma-70 family)
MAAIGKMLEHRFAGRAERHFGDNPPLIQEAIEEAFELLYQDLMNLEPGKRFYEITFNLCALRTVIKAIREVRKRHGMRMNVKGSSDEEKAEDLRRERARIPDRIESRAEVSERTNALEDGETLAAMEKFAGPSLIQEILVAMPDYKHRKILILHAIKKRTFAQTAERAGVSERTARRYYKKATEIAIGIVRGRK